MPQIQVLPYVQSPLEQLTPHINQALSTVGEAWKKRSAMQTLQSLFSPQPAAEGQEQGAAPAFSPVNVGAAYNVLSDAIGPEGAKQATAAMIQQQNAAQKEQAQIRKEQRTKATEEAVETKEKKGKSESLQRAVDTMSNFVAKNAPGIGISPLTKTGLSRQGVQNRAEFDTIRSRFEAALLPLVNKGTLAKPRFDYIMSNIPQASDSQREIAGKIKGLTIALSEEGMPLNTKILESIPWYKESQVNVPEQQSQSAPSGLQKNEVIVISPEGKRHAIDKNELNQLPAGWKAE